ncbi:MAG: glycosyltransferase [Brevundimonas sp.]|uniref:glycosyltransferase n=1 Tax=Brevundimonas sp. TaxID=1871086 RepID=UPI00391B9DE7
MLKLAAEAAQLRVKVMTLSAENERLKDTISFQLGNLLLRAKTWRGLVDLPSGLARLRRQSLERRGRKSARDPHLNPETAARIQDLSLRAFDMRTDDIVEAALTECRDPKLAMRVVADLSMSLQLVDFDKSLALARRTVEHDPSPHRVLWLAGVLYNAGMIQEPLALYQRLDKSHAALPANARLRRDLIEGLARIQQSGLSVPPRRSVKPVKDRSLLYVAASSFPHHVTGYAARTHSLIKAISRQGWRVEAVTRPGYPADRNDAQHVTGRLGPQDVDGVIYSRLAGPPSNATPFDRYCDESSQALLEHIHKVRPSVVQAASNHVNAAPALMAARKAGLPFVYEVRGLWELTSAARTPHWEGSERFEFQRRQETRVAQEADSVVAISNGLRNELISRGVDARKIIVVPNSVDPQVFSPRPRDNALASEMGLDDRRVLGFLGSMTGYEGLVDLITALSHLRSDGLDVCALLVGDGPAFREIREAARVLGVSDHLIMPGRVPHTEAPRWYSLMDVAVYPRRPAQVTELVPPLKPLEAMAMELPVVASNVSAISETLIHRENGFLFNKGDVGELTDLLGEVMGAPDRSMAVARNARRDVEKRFTWTRAAASLDDHYSQWALKAA